MGEVARLPTREEREPHLAGKAICTACKREWAAVAPIGTTELQCPSCGTWKGLWQGAVEPEAGKPIFRCNCGSELFYIVPEGPRCRECGVFAVGWF